MQIELPPEITGALTKLAHDLGISPQELVDRYVWNGAIDAMQRRQKFLDALEDHSQILGWLPDGTPKLKD